MTNTLDTITSLLQHSLDPQWLQVHDNSEQHRHHKQAPKGQGHFHVCISNECFKSTSRLAQHKEVYAILAPLMNTKIHALKLSITAHQADVK